MPSGLEYITDETKRSLTPVKLLEIEFSEDEVLRYNDIDVIVSIVQNNETKYFYPCGFRIRSVTQPTNLEVGRMRIDLDNVEKSEIGGLFLNADRRGAKVTFYLGILEADYPTNWTFTVFRGYINDYSVTDRLVSIEAIDEFGFWNKVLLRRCSFHCNWKFKGYHCGYTGSETECDKSFARCVEIWGSEEEARKHFGGFRWIPAVEGLLPIWWGREKK